MTWVSIKQACTETQRSKKSIYNWIKQELIKTKKDGENRLVWLEDALKVSGEKRHSKGEISRLQGEIGKLQTQYSQALRRIDYYQRQLESVKLLESKEAASRRRIQQLERDLKLLKQYTANIKSGLKKSTNDIKKIKSMGLWDRITKKGYDDIDDDYEEEEDDYDDDEEDEDDYYDY